MVRNEVTQGGSFWTRHAEGALNRTRLFIDVFAPHAVLDQTNWGRHGAASASRLMRFSIRRLITNPIGSIR